MTGEILPADAFSTLPNFVATGLAKTAHNAAEASAHHTERSGTWAGIAALRGIVISEHERSVVDPHRLAWNEATSLMSGTARSLATRYENGDLEMRWNFVLTQMHDNGTGSRRPLMVTLEAAAHESHMPTPIWRLFRETVGLNKGKNRVRSALGEIGLNTGIWPRAPHKDKWKAGFTKAFIAEASSVSGRVYILNGDEVEPTYIEGSAEKIYKYQLLRARNVAWQSKRYKDVRETLNEDTLDAFFAAATGSKDAWRPDSPETVSLDKVMQFMRKNLCWDIQYGVNWSTESPTRLCALVELAKESLSGEA